MATVIQIKRSSGTTAPSELALGELAYTYGTGTQGNNGDRLFVGVDGEQIDVIGGKYFTGLTSHALGTLTASAALLVDSNKAIDTLNVGNGAAAGGLIKFNGGTNNGSHYVGLKSPASVASSIELTLPSSYSNGQFLTVDGSGVLSFAAIPSDSFTIAGNSDTDTFTTGQTLTISGATGITTSIPSDNTIEIDLDDTAVTAGSYGSSTEIPTFTVDQQGRLTAAGTASISTTLDIAADGGTDDGVLLGTDTLTFTGGTGISTSVSGDTVTFTLSGTLADFNSAVSDATLVSTSGAETLSNKVLTSPDINGGTIDGATINGGTIGATTAVTELQVDNININENVISSTNSNGNISLSPNGSGSIDVNSAKITELGTPTVATDAATKGYVDTIAAAGIHYHDPVRVEAPSNLNATYNNGTDGVGATLTNAGTQVALSIDGVTLSLDDRVLIYNQTNAAHNGIYYVSDAGSGASNWELTRTTDTDSYGASDPDAFGQGDAFFVKEGVTGAGELYVMNTEGAITFGTTSITFAQVAETAVYSAASAGALTLTGTEFSVNVDTSTIEISSNDLQVKDGGITDSKLASNAVTTIKITDANVTNAKLANSTITIAGGDASSDAVALGETLTITDGEGIDTSISANTLTIAAELATTSNKGVASFSSLNFAVSSGEVTVTSIDGGTFS